jgi:hypothetical protein
MLLLGGHPVERFLLQDLKLKHPPADQAKTDEDQTEENEDPDFQPIDRLSFHRMTIT